MVPMVYDVNASLSIQARIFSAIPRSMLQIVSRGAAVTF